MLYLTSLRGSSARRTILGTAAIAGVTASDALTGASFPLLASLATARRP